MPAPASKVEEWVSLLATGSNLVLSIAQDALEGASDACLTTLLMSSYLAAFFRWHVRSTTDTLGMWTLKAMPMTFPFSSGII